MGDTNLIVCTSQHGDTCDIVLFASIHITSDEQSDLFTALGIMKVNSMSCEHRCICLGDNCIGYKSNSTGYDGGMSEKEQGVM